MLACAIPDASAQPENGSPVYRANKAARPAIDQILPGTYFAQIVRP